MLTLENCKVTEKYIHDTELCQYFSLDFKTFLLKNEEFSFPWGTNPGEIQLKVFWHLLTVGAWKMDGELKKVQKMQISLNHRSITCNTIKTVTVCRSLLKIYSFSVTLNNLY